ncbi:hypothetical protein E2C01_017350 [Portunus trituberculatus]|uniref:Uncharacterized protein n=1 Tax=Portunus trituberculatus TaxID=210409 RepID=A0A5B7DT79_PORTR|nr:hypothetical protein [Portunus trituberculatus]
MVSSEVTGLIFPLGWRTLRNWYDGKMDWPREPLAKNLWQIFGSPIGLKVITKTDAFAVLDCPIFALPSLPSGTAAQIVEMKQHHILTFLAHFHTIPDPLLDCHSKAKQQVRKMLSQGVIKTAHWHSDVHGSHSSSGSNKKLNLYSFKTKIFRSDIH